jgi:hypothetical protein
MDETIFAAMTMRKSSFFHCTLPFVIMMMMMITIIF